MTRFRVIEGLIGAALVLLSGALQAQDASGGAGGMIREIGRLGEGHIAIFLIFGTGFVASLLWGIGAVISSLRQDVPNGERLRDEMAALEQRVATLEKSLGAVRTENHSPAAR